MARSIRSTSPVMKNQFSCRPAACVKCGTRSKFPQKNPQISSAWFSFGCFVRSALFHADCSRRSSCFRYCLFEESVDHHSRCWCICGSLFFSKKSVRSPLSVGAFVVQSMSERPSRSRCIAARCHAAMRRPGSDRNLPCVRSWSTSL